MSSPISTAYDELLDLLADEALSNRILNFKASAATQARIEELLEKNRNGALSAEEAHELDVYERFDHLVCLLKARILQKRPG